MVLKITDQTIGDVLQDDKLLVIDFWATWCNPCKMMTPIINELGADNPDVNIGKLDVSENVKAAADYMITSIPCIVFIKNGLEIDRIRGAVPKKVIQAKIDKYRD